MIKIFMYFAIGVLILSIFMGIVGGLSQGFERRQLRQKMGIEVVDQGAVPPENNNTSNQNVSSTYQKSSVDNRPMDTARVN